MMDESSDKMNAEDHSDNEESKMIEESTNKLPEEIKLAKEDELLIKEKENKEGLKMEDKTLPSVQQEVEILPSVQQEVETLPSEEEEEEEEHALEKEPIIPQKKPSDFPDFASIYSFISLFGGYLELPIVSIMDLEQVFASTYQLSTDKENLSVLELIYLKLFRRLKQSAKFSYLANVSADKLVKAILKFSYQLHFEHASDLQHEGYQSLTIEERLMMLKHLCEVQFEENVKFRAVFQDAYKGELAAVLRLKPFGVEQEGFHIWFHEDKECNLRVYAGGCSHENINDWDIRASNFEDLESYISSLKLQTEINPKDTAAERAKEMKEIREIERQKKRQEREAKKKAELEKKKTGKRKGKRASKAESIKEEVTSSEEEDDGCVKCQTNNQDTIVLLCDTCDGGYHAACLLPPLLTIPEGDWFCPYCEQLELIKKLQQKQTDLRSKLKAKERASKRLQFYGIRRDNILEQETEVAGRRSVRAKKVDYNFCEFDRLVEDAVRSSEEEGGGEERKARKTNGVSRTSSGRASKRRYNISADECSDNDIDYMESDAANSPDDFVVGDDYDEAEERHKNKYLRRSKRASKYSSISRSRKKKQRRRGRFYDDDDDDETSDDDNQDSEDDDAPRRSSRIRRGGAVVKYADVDEDDVYGSDVDVDKAIETTKKENKDDDEEYKKESDVDEAEDQKEESDEENDNVKNKDDEGSDTSNRSLVTRKRKTKFIESDDSDVDKKEDEELRDNEEKDDDGDDKANAGEKQDETKVTNDEPVSGKVDETEKHDETKVTDTAEHIPITNAEKEKQDETKVTNAEPVSDNGSCFGNGILKEDKVSSVVDECGVKDGSELSPVIPQNFESTANGRNVEANNYKSNQSKPPALITAYSDPVSASNEHLLSNKFQHNTMRGSAPLELDTHTVVANKPTPHPAAGFRPYESDQKVTPIENKHINPYQQSPPPHLMNHQRIGSSSPSNHLNQHPSPSNHQNYHPSQFSRNIPYSPYPLYPQHQQPQSPVHPQHRHTQSPAHPQHQQPQSPIYPQHRQPQSPAHPQHQQPQSPAHPQHQQPQSPAHPQHRHPQSPAHPQHRQPQSPAHPQHRHPQSPAHPQHQQPQSPIYPQHQQPQSPAHPQHRQPQSLAHPQHRHPQHIQNQQHVHSPKSQQVRNIYPGNFPAAPPRHFYGGTGTPYANQWNPSNVAANTSNNTIHNNSRQWPYIPQQKQVHTPEHSPLLEDVPKKKRDKEQKKASKKQASKPPNNRSNMFPGQTEAARSMNYFRNMVISADNDD